MKAYEGKRPYIYISYAYKDAEKVLPVIEHLYREGFRVWYDMGNEDEKSRIEHLANSSCVIAFLSNANSNSKYCMNELVLANRLAKNILPIYLEDIEMNSGLQLQLSRWQGIFRSRYRSSENFLEALIDITMLKSYRDDIYDLLQAMNWNHIPDESQKKRFGNAKWLEWNYIPDEREKMLLENTQELDWEGRGFRYIPCSITALKNLRKLNLKDNQLLELPEELCSLTNLTELNLQGNQLMKLSERFSELKNLEKLYLGDNPWETFPEQLKAMKNLKTLSLQGCRFEEVPEWILDFNLPFSEDNRGIILTDAQIATPPLSVFYQSREAITTYYRRLREEVEIRETKVVFLGDGGVGKTYTIDRMFNNNQRLDEKHQTDVTKGISITHKDFKWNDDNIKIHFWDFGGQQIMHSMHRCFLTNNTVYVIVLSGRAEDMERRLDYWMSGLNTFTGGDCPVIIFENCFSGKSAQSMNAGKAKRDYPNIEDILSFSAKDACDEVFRELEARILECAIHKSHYRQKIGKAWADVKKSMETSDKPYIDEKTYNSICSSEMKDTERRDILTWLNDLGVSFSYHSDKEHIILHDYVVLNPEWATNAIYAIITAGGKWAKNGILTHSQIEEILTQKNLFVNQSNTEIPLKYSGTEITYILALMRKFRIAYEAEEGKEFIPSLCPNDEHGEVGTFIENCDLHYEFQYDYLPMNILHGLMIESYQDLEEDKWWYSGVFFDSEAYRCNALIIQEAGQYSDKISIYVKQKHKYDGEAWRYLLKIREKLVAYGNDLNISADEYIMYHEKENVEPIRLNDVINDIESGWLEYRSRVFKREIPYAEILKTVTAPDIANVVVNGGLLKDELIGACLAMQKRASWLPKKENERNDYLCDLLTSAKITIQDQPRCGVAKIDAGNLDFLVQNSNGQDCAIIEALNLKGINRKNIQEHITKLMSSERYNVSGTKELYLLSYVETTHFEDFKEKYRDFVKEEAVYPAERKLKSLDVMETSANNIYVLQGIHEGDTTVCHICVKIYTEQKMEALDIRTYQIGDNLFFGRYEQDNELTNGPEEICWRVLDKQDDKLLVISEQCLDAKPYNIAWKSVTWETCTLRKWLNEEFYEMAFTEQEKERISLETIQNPDNPRYGTKGGVDTTDKLFLLSIEEVKKYFSSDEERQAKATDYAKAQRCWISGETGNSIWWLRSPGDITFYAAGVHSGGGVGHGGDYVYRSPVGIRPALWIKS